MSQQDETTRTTGTEVEPGQAPTTTAPANGPGADGPTVGTGTSIALGCVAGTILLIVVGLIYILILALF